MSPYSSSVVGADVSPPLFFLLPPQYHTAAVVAAWRMSSRWRPISEGGGGVGLAGGCDFLSDGILNHTENSSPGRALHIIYFSITPRLSICLRTDSDFELLISLLGRWHKQPTVSKALCQLRGWETVLKFDGGTGPDGWSEKWTQLFSYLLTNTKMSQGRWAGLKKLNKRHVAPGP